MGLTRTISLGLLLLASAAGSCGGESVRDRGDPGDAGESSGGSAATTGSGGTPGSAGIGTAGPGVVGGACEAVACEEQGPCQNGWSARRAPGACCSMCVPNVGVVTGCDRLPCPAELECPLGYTPGGGELGGCCYECVPDPAFCVTHDDCLLAMRHAGTSCCACPHVVSARLYADDTCWFGGPERRAAPAGCPGNCGAGDVACPCANPGEPYCADNRCVSGFVPPPN